MKTRIVPILAALTALSLSPTMRADNIASLFVSTSDPSAWTVSTNVSGVDTGPNNASNFLTGNGDFHSAVAVDGRPDFIANNATGTNGWVGDYTQFVFQQTFDLTGYDPATAVLTFQWAADDTGEGFADRGTWQNRFTLNGSGFLGVDSDGYYNYDPSKIVQISSGFVAGLNTIDFYVQGNGVTDGFELRTLSFAADPSTGTVPDGGMTLALLGSALIGLAALRKRFLS